MDKDEVAHIALNVAYTIGSWIICACYAIAILFFYSLVFFINVLGSKKRY